MSIQSEIDKVEKEINEFVKTVPDGDKLETAEYKDYVERAINLSMEEKRKLSDGDWDAIFYHLLIKYSRLKALKFAQAEQDKIFEKLKDKLHDLHDAENGFNSDDYVWILKQIDELNKEGKEE
jgi:hypothetical protein